MWALNGLAMWVWKSKGTLVRFFVVNLHHVLLFIFNGRTSYFIVSVQLPSSRYPFGDENKDLWLLLDIQ